MPRVTFIIAAGLRQASIAKCEAKGQDGSFLRPGLVGMFTTPLRAAGNPNGPITHWISSGHMSQQEIDYLNANLPPAFQSFEDDDGFSAMAAMSLELADTGAG